MVNYSPKLVSSDVHGVKLWPVFCILTSVTNTSRIWVTSHPIPYINSTVTGYMSKFYEAIKWIKQMSQPFLQWPKTEKCYISSISCSEPFFQKIWSYRSNSYVTKHPPGDFYSIIMFLTQENAKKWKNAKTQMSNFSPTLMTASKGLNYRCMIMLVSMGHGKAPKGRYFKFWTWDNSRQVP